MLLATLTPEQKIWLLEQADQRDRLTDKALAAQLGVSVQTVNSILAKLRKARRETQASKK